MATSISSPEQGLTGLYEENIIAKIWRVATINDQKEPPTRYPHTVPQTGQNAGTYEYREADFWTCGFFPGSLYSLLERYVKFPGRFPLPDHLRARFHEKLLTLCHYWDGPIHRMAPRTDTHDMGFIIQPALRADWELNGNPESLKAVVTAAHALASRYDERVKAIRSWDEAINYRYSFTDMERNFLVIIDSMCNLDLLCYAGHHTGDQHLIEIAITHAHTVLQHIVRPNSSTYHLVNFVPSTGRVQNKLTNQGYADESTWTRGQAWGILGFTQMYTWTKDETFLKAAVSLSKYFLMRLDEATHEYPYVPVWDFDAPVTEGEQPLRDTSAGMIAANGFLLLHQALSTSNTKADATLPSFLKAALKITRQTIALSLSQSKVSFSRSFSKGNEIVVLDDEGKGKERFDGILRNATSNRNPDAHKPYWDHGLVYADYYFLELGNKLLRMGVL